MTNTTIQQLLDDATRRLRTISSTPRLDAELLLAHTLGCSRARLLAILHTYPDPAHISAFLHTVERRNTHEPVAYILGQRAFYGLDLLVDKRVLVPRPETEILVEAALAAAGAWSSAPSDTFSIVDVGTGSGAIAIALALHLPQASILATDISLEALAVARQNIQQHGVEKQITLLAGDLLTPLPHPVDLIVSNPPYTILSEIEQGVYQHEPHLALDGGIDGLDIYRRLLEQAPRWLKQNGEILLEIGATQATAVSALFRTLFPNAQINILRDLAGHNRVVAAQT